MEGTIGEIRLFAATFAPRSWWYCDGSIMAIRSNTALFSILGTMYGGDGVNTFGLPDLRGRTAVGAGQGPGLTYYPEGTRTGTNAITLTNANLPAHTHPATASVSIPAYSDEGNTNNPSGNILAAKAQMYSSQPGDTTMRGVNVTGTTSVAGGNQPLAINQPCLGMSYIICLNGVFPQRQ